jgi:hypothetical protein
MNREFGDDVEIRIKFHKGSDNMLRDSFIRNVKQWLSQLSYLNYNIEYIVKEGKEIQEE